VQDGEGRLLLVRRGREPARGLWSIPGGRLERDEDAESAVIREVAEETGLAVVPRELLGVVELPGPGAAVFVVRDYRCELVGERRTPVPGDDAEAADWFTPAQLGDLPTTPLLLGYLAQWGVYRPADSQT